MARDPAATVKVTWPRKPSRLPDGSQVEFPIDPFSKHCLLEGVDELGYILKQEAAIAAYEGERQLTLNTLA